MSKRHITLERFQDINGNSCIRVKSKTSHASFSIQTNGNLPNCHRFSIDSFGDLKKCLSEIFLYCRKFGTMRQRTIIYDVLQENNINYKKLI